MERPILFSAPMVRALLDGTKSQTRRVVKITHRTPGLAACLLPSVGAPRPRVAAELCPYGQPGDRLWVRETRQAVRGDDRARHICTQPKPGVGWLEYAATPRQDEPAYKWRPSIHMPRWASRIELEVTGVRVERLQDISEADAIAEGIERRDDACGNWKHYLDTGLSTDAVGSYRSLWELINGESSWNANPWVWVVEFRRIRP